MDRAFAVDYPAFGIRFVFDIYFPPEFIPAHFRSSDRNLFAYGNAVNYGFRNLGRNGDVQSLIDCQVAGGNRGSFFQITAVNQMIDYYGRVLL